MCTLENGEVYDHDAKGGKQRCTCDHRNISEFGKTNHVGGKMLKPHDSVPHTIVYSISSIRRDLQINKNNPAIEN